MYCNILDILIPKKIVIVCLIYLAGILYLINNLTFSKDLFRLLANENP